MTGRFKIEDMIAQDTSGVVFRAFDAETGSTVAVRRFFPFGMDGGGFLPDEQTAYQTAIERLTHLNHPALRSIVCGGCDPVDGIPFIVTECIEGPSLETFVEPGPLSSDAACTLISQALEVCELLSQVLGEEAVWVETDPQSIIAGNDNSDRSFTFWISPLKWLGGPREGRGMESIVALTERVMWWQGQIVGDQAGRGLGRWHKWLRANAAHASLREVRESLAASVNPEPPPSAEQLAPTASRPSFKASPSKKPLRTTIVLALMVGSAAVGWFFAQGAHSRLPVVETTKSPPAAGPKAPDLAVELSEEPHQAEPQKTSTLERKRTSAAENGDVILWDDYEHLLAKKGLPVVVEGLVQGTDRSNSGKTVYLLFGLNGVPNATRAAIKVGDSKTDEMIDKLETFVGKHVHVSGKVALTQNAVFNGPEIKVKKLSDIRIVE